MSSKRNQLRRWIRDTAIVVLTIVGAALFLWSHHYNTEGFERTVSASYESLVVKEHNRTAATPVRHLSEMTTEQIKSAYASVLPTVRSAHRAAIIRAYVASLAIVVAGCCWFVTSMGLVFRGGPPRRQIVPEPASAAAGEASLQPAA